MDSNQENASLTPESAGNKHDLIDKITQPTSALLKSADDGSLFRKPLTIVMMILAVLIALGSLLAFFKLVGNAFLPALGLLIAGVLSAQVVLYRANRISGFPPSNFPVTPIGAEIFRAVGGCMAVQFAVVGVFTGIGALITSNNPNLPGPLAELSSMGVAAIAGGPIMGFITLICFHGVAEVLSAMVAIANNTSKE